jgi:Fe-S-cluster-containing hydrogenase component 2
LAYALAGADCIDVAADPAVVTSAQEAIDRAHDLATRGWSCDRAWVRPLLMVSLNDGEDPHFRKATFDAATCPPTCPRPCETICPAQAIAFVDGKDSRHSEQAEGVIANRCYGCGRCLPICPLGKISTVSHQVTPGDLLPLVSRGIDAIEINTQVGRRAAFQELWQTIAPLIPQLKLVAVSCPDDPDVVDYLRSLYAVMQPPPATLIWQADGRPMSGDIGQGTTHRTIRFGQKLLAAGLPGYVQLAGGTNHYTVEKLRSLGLLPPSAPAIAGVAYGSYARTLLSPILEALEENEPNLSTAITARSPCSLADSPDRLQDAIRLARSLIHPLKTFTHDLEATYHA